MATTTWTRRRTMTTTRCCSEWELGSPTSPRTRLTSCPGWSALHSDASRLHLIHVYYVFMFPRIT